MVCNSPVFNRATGVLHPVIFLDDKNIYVRAALSARMP